MIIPRIKAVVSIDSPFKVVAVYALAGTVWIVGSGLWVARMTGENGAAWRMDMVKGLLFIAATTALLYLLVRRLVARYRAAEKALRRAQERWSFALESAGTGLWEWNGVTGEAFFSPEWKAILGYTDREIPNLQSEWLSRIHPEDRPRVEALLEKHLAAESGPYEAEYRMLTKTGTQVWILARGKVVERDADGRALKVFGTHTDITARKNAKARSTDALALARAVFHSSPVGVVAYGPDGQAVMANHAASRIVGTDVAGLLGQNYRQLESWQRSGLKTAADQALAEDRPVTYRGPVQTTFGRSIWMQAQFVPFTYKDERHLLFIIEDVTETHQAQENLRLMETAVRAAPVGWVVTDPDGKIEWVNPGFTTITGYTAAEVVGGNPRKLKSGRHSEEFYRTMWATIRRGEVWTGEIFNSRKDGGIYQERMTIAPVRDQTGVITHYVAIKQDITGEKQLEQQLARAQRLESIGMLASGIAHDLNNIFAPILLSMELLKLKYPTADSRKTLEMVETTCQRGAGIVRQLLTFARGIDGERTEIQLKYVLKEAAQILGETLPRSIQVETEITPNLPAVLGDATQLHQVLLNLAVNARDAMPDGGHLKFAATLINVDEARAARNHPLRAGPCVALAVSDTGTGIPPGVVEHMFEPFFTTKPLGKGTGLGLSTVYGIVRGHGGAIEVQTEPGKGTVFTLLLPALDRRLERPDSRPPLEMPLAGEGRRILVVDDEEPIRLITLHALQRHDFKVETAIDGVEGLEIFRSDPDRFAAIITDLMMPRMNGREMIQEIRRLAPDVSIIASSGFSEENSRIGSQERLAALGVPVLLRKPYTEGELLTALRREFEARSARERQKNG